MKDVEKSLALIAVGLGFLYFAWVFSTMGIYVGSRGHDVVTAADPDRFSVRVALVFVVGAVSLVAGVISIFRR